MRNPPTVCTDKWFDASQVTRANIGNQVRNYGVFTTTPSAIIKKLCRLETFLQLARCSLGAYSGGGGGTYGAQKVMALIQQLAKDPRQHKLWPMFVLFCCHTEGKYCTESYDESAKFIAANLANYPEDYQEDFNNFLRVCDKNEILPVTYCDDWCDNLAEILDEE